MKPDTTQTDATADVATFVVEGMRVLASDNEDVAFVIKGTSFVRDGKPVSIKSKAIDIETARSDAFALDIEAGTFTVPVGKRGRHSVPGLDADSIAAKLAELRA